MKGLNMNHIDKNAMLDDICAFLESEVEDFCRNSHLDTSFSRLGLDSMGHVQLSSIVEKHTGQEIDPTLAFDYPTINSMLEHLQAQLKENADAI
ncbi:phosphopantetheine-binding protein [Photobacterium sanctipauli]|uniref:Phosphopantetheine-binding protein n=1 Tax=Photobacterium sanctipauli TaxID=1342794 RepID=A0A2T3P1B1_9GAMM|nr:acyl carrier protein [Photobacterium sanctipauli]PSW22269.1 phosphopantetheine-binding protein [Photobacterium sanctipauli]